ncbi:hypothetical protein CPTSV76_014 [Enterobacteria phage SV76]|nr:hypothetical protein CPTSV76_014 [Enterobacteria phage SV76]
MISKVRYTTCNRSEFVKLIFIPSCQIKSSSNNKSLNRLKSINHIWDSTIFNRVHSISQCFIINDTF